MTDPDPRPMTDEEAGAPVLDMDAPPPVTTGTLRHRIRLLDDAARGVFLQRWAASGLPQVLADADGGDVWLDRDDHVALERLIAEHEPPADPGEHRALFEWVGTLSRHAKVLIEDRLRNHGLGSDQLSPSVNVTTGRHYLLTTVIDSVLEQVDTGAVPYTDDPVAPPDGGTVVELVAWVDGDPLKAARLLEQEQVKAKPRKGLVDQLSKVIAEEVVAVLPPVFDPAPAAEAATDPGCPLPSVPGVVVSAPPPAAGADARYTSKPVGEWGRLDRQAFFSRLSSDLEKASRILAALAHETGVEAK